MSTCDIKWATSSDCSIKEYNIVVSNIRPPVALYVPPPNLIDADLTPRGRSRTV